ncbi:MAG: isoprenyl transferase [Halanaerobium sp. MSAO_Bac5]|nr:MAG: isoprenyl transferase [Halanaerobium sp. MSAO_Bac5]
MFPPQNIAIIMDGNGRWAKKRNLARREGHKEGVKTLKKIVKYAAKKNIKSLTVYAFSTENWKRPKSEVNFLLALMRKTMREEVDELLDKGVKINFLGRKDVLSKKLIKEIELIEKKSQKNTELILNIAFNYGGRAEIVDAAKKLVLDCRENQVELAELNCDDFANYLYQQDLKDIELLIRTGGEKRLSNFLLWQTAYAELYFTDKYWPDFKEEDFEIALKDFKKRERRFGGLNDGDQNA